MPKPKRSLKIKKTNVSNIQEDSKREVISTSVLNLNNIVSDIELDIEKLDVYISAIRKLTDNKHTPFDEVNEIKDILESVEQQSKKLKHRHSDLLRLLENTKKELLLKG